MNKTKDPIKASSRRRMRIRAIADEWLRNPWLLMMPALILLFSGMADVMATQQYYAVASSFVLLSHTSLVVLAALLSVAVVRL